MTAAIRLVRSLGTSAANVVLHVLQAARQHRYNPGLVTAVTLLVPTVASGLRELGSDPQARGRDVLLGSRLGVGIGATAFGGARWAARRRRS